MNEQLEDIEICEHCHGTGEVDTMAPVYEGEAPMAFLGTIPCICQTPDEDEN